MKTLNNYINEALKRSQSDYILEWTLKTSSDVDTSIADTFLRTGNSFYNDMKDINLDFKYLYIEKSGTYLTPVKIASILFKKNNNNKNLVDKSIDLKVYEDVVNYDKDHLLYYVAYEGDYFSNDTIKKNISKTVNNNILETLDKSDINDIKILVGIKFINTYSSIGSYMDSNEKYSRLPNEGIGYLKVSNNMSFSQNDNWMFLCDYNLSNMKKLKKFLTEKE